MAQTVEPNARSWKNTLDALAACNVPLQRIMLAAVPSRTASVLGVQRSSEGDRATSHCAVHYHQQEDMWLNGPLRTS